MMTKPVKYEINFAGIAEAKSVMEFDFDSSLFVAFAESGVEGGEGKIILDVIKHPSMLEITAAIKGELILECDRCADSYRQPIEYKGSVVVKMSSQQGEYEGDIIWVDPQQTMIDLTQWIYESIILSLPIQRVHLQREQCNAEVLKYIQGQ